MYILDRYVISRWFKSLFGAVFAATLIFLVVDFVDHLAGFVDAAPGAKVIAKYYLYFIPSIIYLTMPVSSLLATLFTIGGMTQSNELMAMESSGVPFRRPLMLLILSAIAVAYGTYNLGETVVPLANRLRNDIERYDIKKSPRESASRLGRLYLQIGQTEQLFIETYNSTTREAFKIELVDVQAGRVKQHTRAEKMVWRSGLWRLQGAVEQTFTMDGKINLVNSDSLILTGAELNPTELENIQTQPQEMNRQELTEFIDRLRTAGSITLKWEVERLSKLASPVASVIIVLFGAPLAAVRRRGGTALGFGLALLVCFVYFAFIEIGKIMGNNGSLPPMLAVWFGNGFFGLLGLISIAFGKR